MATLDDLLKTYCGQKVLITGGAGFIGSNLARRLVNLGALVTIVDSLIPDYGGNLFNLAEYQDRLQLNIADVRDQYSMNYLVRGQNYLFNLAGQVSHTDSMQNPYTDLEINVRAQISILEACRKDNPAIRILFASTRQIYGKPVYLPADENHPIDPIDVNGINKAAAEKYHLLYGRLYGIPVSVLRLTNVFGPRMRILDARQTFIGLWLRQIIEGQTIQVFGDGLQLRDLNYVDDVVDAMLMASRLPAAVGEVYNLGGEPISLMDLAKLIVDINGHGAYELVPFPSERKAIDIGSYYGNYLKIQSALGWEPKISLRTGMEQSLAYYRENIGMYF
jgi:UDP-glucose 4-epimerase